MLYISVQIKTENKWYFARLTFQIFMRREGFNP